MTRTILTSTCVAVVLMASGAASASTLTATTGGAEFNDSQRVSTQYRNGQAGTRGAGEIYVAPDSDAGNGEPREEGQFQWSLNQPIDFLFSYDSDGGFGGQGLLTSTLGGTSALYGDVADETVSSDLTFNTLQFNVESRNNGDEAISITSLMINGMGVDSAPFGLDNAFQAYSVTGFGTLSDFTITGSLIRIGEVAGTQQSRPRVDLIAGSADVIDPIPLPAAAWMLLAGVAGLGAVARRRKNS